jgi:chromosome segregation ATPase
MTNELTEEERRDLVELGARPVEAKRALDLIDSLTTQCQRDYQLAAAWQARHEALRVETTFERDRLTARLAELEHANTEAASCIRGLSDERDAALARAEAAEQWNVTLQDARDSLQSECAALRDSVRQASQENDALRAELERADTVGTDLRLEVADLRAEVERRAELAHREGSDTPADSQRSLEELLKDNASLREDLSK